MGALKLVLLAEGIGELGLDVPQRAPGEEIPGEGLGAGHFLIRRMVTSTGLLPEGAVKFVRPMKLPPGRDARGSDLRVISRLRKLTTWPQQKRAPHGSIVLLDDDDRVGIAADLGSQLESSLHPTLVVAAVPEFEAWLLADHGALEGALRASFDMVPTPDRLGRDEAKARLTRLRQQYRPEVTHGDLAKEVVKTVDLQQAASRSTSFRQALTRVVSFTSQLLA